MSKHHPTHRIIRMHRIIRALFPLFSLCILWVSASLAATATPDDPVHPDDPVQLHPKPGSPISVIIEPQQAYQPAQSVSFEVTATSSIATDNFVVTVHPPQRMELLEGQLSWSGAMARGETKILSFTGSFPATGAHLIRAVASVYGPGAAKYAAHATYRIGVAGVAVPDDPKQKARHKMRRTTRNGKGVVEYQMQQ